MTALMVTFIGMNLLDQIYIILIETSHSGNIGSTARAMKTMGLSHLRLVSPKQAIDEQAVSLSAGAKDLLECAQIYTSFEESIADCQLVIGTSARLRHLQSSLIEPRACAELALKRAGQGKVAIVFGRERVGLTNEELLKCHYHLNVPTNPEYGSLNLAMAEEFVLHTPLMWLDKAQTWELADQMGKLEYIAEKTVTCYHGLPGAGCGECPSCLLRAKGLEAYLQQRQPGGKV